MKILIIRFSSIGDIVLTSPVVRCVKTQRPDIDVHFLTKAKFASLLEFNPYVDRLHRFNQDLAPLLADLKKEKFDLIIDLHRSLRSRWVCARLGVRTIGFRKENFGKWWLVRTGKDILPHNHIVDRYLEAVAPLGIQNDQKGLDFFPCDCEEPDENEFPDFLKEKPFVVFSVGGTHFTKRMPGEKWRELLIQMNYPVVIAGGPEDTETGRYLESEGLRAGKLVWNACGRFSIGGSAHLVKKSSLVLTHDTGLMHIAAAFKKPIVAIWGNTTPRFGMFPYHTSHLNLEVENLSCRPCSRIGFPDCPKGHFSCMKNQELHHPELNRFIEAHLPV